LKFLTLVLDKECSSFEEDFLADLKIFLKPLAGGAKGEKKFLKDERKDLQMSCIPYPKLAFLTQDATRLV